MDAFRGRPVWLASYSIRDKRGQIIGTPLWSDGRRRAAERVLFDALRGVGDESCAKLFRMNITLCMHRALTAEEQAGLPTTWQRDLSGMAGGPIELYWHKGVEDRPEIHPCIAPSRKTIVPGRPDLWFPEDCGRCTSCEARAAIECSIAPPQAEMEREA